MIRPRPLQMVLLAYLAAATPLEMEGLHLRGSDDTRPVELPMLVVHVSSIADEFGDSGVYRCQVGFQLHTQADDEDGEDASERLDLLAAALEEDDELIEALGEHFVTSAIENKGLTLHHKEQQLIHALRMDFILSENPD